MLSERNQNILCAVVESYIESPLPVGSRAVTKKYSFNLSPATVRNAMADLEDMGFLSQPHTSAGRIPTDKGYRAYVDCLCKEGGDAREEFYSILREKLEAIKSDLNSVFSKVTITLSAISHYLVFAASQRSAITLNRIQFYRYRGRHTAAVILTNEGIIKNKVIAMDFGLSQKDLNRISDYLNSEFSGRSIDEIRLKVLRQLSKEKALCDILVSKAMAICREALNFPSDEVYISGLSEFLWAPEFSSRIKEIVRVIEDKHLILRLLDELASPNGLRVVIGSENPLSELKEFSIVLAPFKQGGRSLGCLGVIGPRRMDYLKTISMVEVAAESISDVISDSGGFLGR